MRATGLLERQGYIWVSRARLLAAGVKPRAVDSWWERKLPVDRYHVGQVLYVRLDTLPARSRALLPSTDVLRAELLTAAATQPVADAAAVLVVLVKARDKEAAAAYREWYAAAPFGPDKGWPPAQRRAVWARLVELADAGTAPAVLWQAHTALGLQGKEYKTLDTFRTALKAARTAWGAGNPDAFVLHGNLNNAHAAHEHYTLHEYLVRALWSTGLAQSKTAVARRLADACAQIAEAKSAHTGQTVTITPPSESWVKQYLLRPDVQRHTDAHRYGEEYVKRHLPYLRMRPALYANDQWQIDGWNVPFYCKGEKGRVTRPVVVVVMDVYSRRLLGWAFGERENGDVILAALRHAVETAGAVPSSIVSDKHSFNKTPEAAYLKEYLTRYGCDWTVSTNPQAKSILERFFGQFEQRYFAALPEFIGAGPADRRPTARLKGERRQELLKGEHTHEWGAAVLLTTELIAHYNTAPLPGRADSPTALYEAGAVGVEVGPRAVSSEHVMRLFWLTREVKASRGGITLQRGAIRYRFTFRTAADVEQWGNSRVLVKYDADLEQILVLCPDTQQTVDVLARDERTNALFAQRTDDDRARIEQQHELKAELKARGQAENQRLTEETEDEWGALAFEAVQGVIGVPKADMANARIAFEVNDTARRHNLDPATPRPRPVQVIPADFAPTGATSRTNTTAATGADPRRPYAGKEGSLKVLAPIDPYADLEGATL